HRDLRLRSRAGRAEHRGVRMSAVRTTEVIAPQPATAGPAPSVRTRKPLTRFILPTYAGLVLLYLVLPILIMILHGFNASGFKRVSFRWQGFSLFGYTHLFNRPDLTAALKNSLVLAVVSAIHPTHPGPVLRRSLSLVPF